MTDNPQAEFTAAALRDRIADAIREWHGDWSKATFAEAADAVLAVLPAPADRPASTAPLAAGFPLVQGRCPACGTAGLFLGSGGYVTCSNADCPEPDAATTVLEGDANWPAVRAAVLREVAEELAGINFHPNAKSQNLELCRLLAGRFRRKADEAERMADEAPQPETQPGCGCPNEGAVEHQFGVEDCTCVPFVREGGTARYCQPGDTVDQISGWERGGDCPHHRTAAVSQPGKEG